MNAEIGARDAEVTFRFPLEPLEGGDHKAIASAVRGSDHRFVRVEDTVLRNLGAGGAGPYFSADFVVPVIQEAAGGVLTVGALAAVRKVFTVLRRKYPQRLLHVKVRGRPEVIYRVLRDTNTDAALDAIPADYNALRNDARDRWWDGQRWVETNGSQTAHAESEATGFLLPAAQRLADVLRHWLFVSSWRRPDSYKSESGRLRWVEGEMLLWLVGLVMAWLAQPLFGPWNAVVIFFAALRILNIVGYSLYSVLWPSHRPVGAFASMRRAVVMGLVNVVTVWAAFGLFYRNAIAWSDKTFALTSSAHAWSESAFISWTNLLTLGNDYRPQNPWAESLVAAELGVGLVVIVVTLAAVVGSLKMESYRP